jgi:hypothetical protein
MGGWTLVPRLGVQRFLKVVAQLGRETFLAGTSDLVRQHISDCIRSYNTPVG